MGSTHSMSRKILLSVLAAAAAFASTAHAAIINVSTQGVIVEHPNSVCSVFEADTGETFTLSSLGGYTHGDRVHVTGTYDTNQFSQCENTGGPTITVSAIQPAFAGVGAISFTKTSTILTTPDNRTYLVPAAGSIRAAGNVYVQGTVTPGSRTLSTINATSVGPGFSGFGRITSFGPGPITFVSEAGATYTLDRPGSIGTQFYENDLIFVEGIRGTTVGGVTPLTSVTARPAFHAKGQVIAHGAGVALDPHTMIFAGPYTATAINSTTIGTSVYVRGRNADDYDYGETKTANFIRESTSGDAYATVGILDVASSTVFSLTDGTTVYLECTGNDYLTPDGTLVYVAGQVASQTLTTVTYARNEVRIGIMEEGYLYNGFGCTPIIVFNTVGWVFPRNTGGYPVNTHVAVTGGLNLQIPCFDLVGLVDNTIIETACPNCE
jgi:hypothetical protein